MTTNKFKVDNKVLANQSVKAVGNNQSLFPHLNMSYQGDFAMIGSGVRAKEVDIFIDIEMSEGEIFDVVAGDEIKISTLEQNIKTLKIDKTMDKSFQFNLIESTFREDQVDRSINAGTAALVSGVESVILQEFYKSPKILVLPTGGLNSKADFTRLSRFAKTDLLLSNGFESTNVSTFVNTETIEDIENSDVQIKNSDRGKEYFDKGFVTKSGKSRDFIANGNGYLFEALGLDFYQHNKLDDVSSFGVLDVDVSEYADTAKYSAKKVDGVLNISLIVEADDEFTIPAGVVIVANKNAHLVLKDIVVASGLEREVDITESVNTTKVNTDETSIDFELRQKSSFDSLIFNKESMLFAMIATPIDGEGQATSTETNTGIGVRISRAKDIKTKTSIISIDCMFGVEKVVDMVAVF